MSVKDVASLGKMLAQFLALFADCFCGSRGQRLLAIYARGLLSDIGRKNVETIALKQNVAPRTLQRAANNAAFSRNDQVGSRGSPSAMPADRRRGTS